MFTHLKSQVVSRLLVTPRHSQSSIQQKFPKTELISESYKNKPAELPAVIISKKAIFLRVFVEHLVLQ